MEIAFLLGFLPMLLVHRARMWTMRRRFDAMERQLAVFTAPMVPSFTVITSGTPENTASEMSITNRGGSVMVKVVKLGFFVPVMILFYVLQRYLDPATLSSISGLDLVASLATLFAVRHSVDGAVARLPGGLFLRVAAG